MGKMRNIGIMLAAWALAMPALGSSLRPVTIQERAYVGATHVATITHSDLTETNVNTPTTLTNVFNVTAKQRVELIAMELVTAFNAGNNATGSVLVTVGDAAAGADFYLDSTELDSNKTEVWQKYGKGFENVTSNTLVYAATNDPTVTVTKQTVTPVFAATNDPTVTVTKQTVTVNPVTNVVGNGLGRTIIDSVTPQYAAITNYHTPVAQYGVFTNVYLDVTNTYNAVTNITWTEVAYQVATNVGSSTQQYDVVSNVVFETAGDVGIMTNATATATLTPGASVAIMTNATATATLTAGTQAVISAVSAGNAGQKVYTADDTVDFTFTPNAVNSLSENTAGEVKFYFRVKTITD